MKVFKLYRLCIYPDVCADVCNKPTDQPCTNGGYQDPNRCSQCLCPDGFAGNFCQLLAPPRNGLPLKLSTPLKFMSTIQVINPFEYR